MSEKSPVSVQPRRRRLIREYNLISRLGTFGFALVLAFIVFIVKRGDKIVNTGDFSPSGNYALCSRTGKAIYTVDEDVPNVQCIAVDGNGLISHVGSIDSVKKSHPDLKVRFIPKSAIVVPGLVDSHVHLLYWGWSRVLNLDGTSSIQEIIDIVKAYILSHPNYDKTTGHWDESEWIEGVGWDQNKWNDWGGSFPTHLDLDADPVLRGKPIILFRTDIHAIWVSGRVLDITGELPSVIKGGEIIRDSTGKPTGIFLDNAMPLVKQSPWSQSQMMRYYERGIKDALAVGLTGVHDASTPDLWIDFFKGVAEDGQLPIRLYLMANREEGYWGKDIQKFYDYGKHKRLTLRSIKLIGDGAIGSWGAVMYKPYSDDPSKSGFFRVPLEVLKKDIPRYINDGWQTNIHCIGDRCNGEVVQILERALKGRNVADLRPRIEHAQIFRLKDIEKVGKLGLIASVQPTHATTDMGYAEARLGDRVKGAYAYKSLLNSGARLALGTDMPIETNNPLATFYAAISRLNSTGQSPHGPDGWFPEQKLTRKEALKGMTLDAAYASFSENTVGSLVVGKKADYVVLSQDIMTVPEMLQILETSVIATVVDGRVMYGAL